MLKLQIKLAGGDFMKLKLMGLLMGILSLFVMGGCADRGLAGAVETDARAMGRYVEADMTVGGKTESDHKIKGLLDIRRSRSGELFTAAFMEDGKINFFRCSQEERWDSMDKMAEAVNAYEATTFISYPITMNDDGNVLLASYIENIDSIFTEIVKIDETGECTAIPLDYPEIQNTSDLDTFAIDNKEMVGNRLNDIQVDGDGCIYGVDIAHRLLKFDPETGAFLQEFIVDGRTPSSYYLAGNVLIIYDGFTYYYFDKDSGKQYDQQPPLTQLLNSSDRRDGAHVAFAGGTRENEIYALTDGCVYRYMMNGNVVECIIDGTLNSLSDPNLEVYRMVVPEDGKLLVLGQFNGITELKKYTYMSDVPALPDQELKIYSLYEDEFLTQSLAIIRRKHPDVYVTLEIGSDSGSKKEALKQLKASMENGSGPDILYFNDGESYGVDDYLLPVDDMMENVKRDLPVYENLFPAEAGTRVIPTRFGMYVCAGSRAAVENGSSLKRLADFARSPAEVGDSSLPYLSLVQLTADLYEVFGGPVVDAKGHVDVEALCSFLEGCHEIFASETIVKIPLDQRNFTDVISEFPAFDGQGLYSRIDDIYNNSGQFRHYKITAVDDICVLWSISQALSQTFDYTFVDTVYCPSAFIGVNQNSSKGELAELFIYEMLSHEIQSLETGGLSVRADVMEAQMQRSDVFMDSVFMVWGDNKEIVDEIHIKWPEASAFESFKASIEAVTVPAAGSWPVLGAAVDDADVDNTDRGSTFCTTDDALIEVLKDRWSELCSPDFDPEQCVRDIMEQLKGGKE